MKWFVAVLLLGIVEVWTTVQLHSVLGTTKLIGLYVATTALGAAFLYIQFPAFRQAMQAMNTAEKTWKKKIQQPGYQPTADDVQRLKPMLFISVYVFAAVLIAIPGIVTDVFGSLLILPVISNWYIERAMTKAMQRATHTG